MSRIGHDPIRDIRGYGFTKYEPNRRNISSSVVTPPSRVHASHEPSPAPALESHERCRASVVEPLHAAPTLPL